MTSWQPDAQERMRQGFKCFNRVMLTLWRLGLGAWINLWPSLGGRIMVIVHRGRKTGKRYQTPVNYAIVDGELYCVAGFGGISDWYRNVTANPEVEVWLPDGWWAGVAEEVSDARIRLPLLRQVLINSGLAARLAGLYPATMSDEALRQATADYRLIHIRRTQARTGPGGPGELAWIWPLATFVLLWRLISRRRR